MAEPDKLGKLLQLLIMLDNGMANEKTLFFYQELAVNIEILQDNGWNVEAALKQIHDDCYKDEEDPTRWFLADHFNKGSFGKGIKPNYPDSLDTVYNDLYGDQYEFRIDKPSQEAGPF